MLVKVGDKVGGVSDVVGGFPCIILVPISCPFDLVLEFPSEHPTVQYFFDFPFLRSINDFRRWRRASSATRNWVSNGGSELDDIKDRV